MTIARDPTPAHARRTDASRAEVSAPAYPLLLDPLRLNVPHWARVYDYWLGGKDNFAVDRAVADTIRQDVPTVAQMVRASRAWMHRATAYLVAQAGIRQILDLGIGLPMRPDLHETAQHIAPDTRVVYVANDPIVLTHLRARMISTPQGRCAYLDADIRDIDTLVHSAELTDTFDLNEPVAVMAASTLMLLSDQDDPWAITATLRDWSPDGSYLAISHPTADTNPAMTAVADTAASVGITVTPRSHAQVAAMFGDWPLIEPGLVPALAWKPDNHPPDDPDTACSWAGIART